MSTRILKNGLCFMAVATYGVQMTPGELTVELNPPSNDSSTAASSNPAQPEENQEQPQEVQEPPAQDQPAQAARVQVENCRDCLDHTAVHIKDTAKETARDYKAAYNAVAERPRGVCRTGLSLTGLFTMAALAGAGLRGCGGGGHHGPTFPDGLFPPINPELAHRPVIHHPESGDPYPIAGENKKDSTEKFTLAEQADAFCPRELTNIPLADPQNTGDLQPWDFRSFDPRQTWIYNGHYGLQTNYANANGCERDRTVFFAPQEDGPKNQVTVETLFDDEHPVCPPGEKCAGKGSCSYAYATAPDITHKTVKEIKFTLVADQDTCGPSTWQAAWVNTACQQNDGQKANKGENKQEVDIAERTGRGGFNERFVNYVPPKTNGCSAEGICQAEMTTTYEACDGKTLSDDCRKVSIHSDLNPNAPVVHEIKDLPNQPIDFIVDIWNSPPYMPNGHNNLDWISKLGCKVAVKDLQVSKHVDTTSPVCSSQCTKVYEWMTQHPWEKPAQYPTPMDWFQGDHPECANCRPDFSSKNFLARNHNLGNRDDSGSSSDSVVMV